MRIILYINSSSFIILKMTHPFGRNSCEIHTSLLTVGDLEEKSHLMIYHHLVTRVILII